MIATALAAAVFDLPVRDAAGVFGASTSWGPLGIALFLVATVIVALRLPKSSSSAASC